MKHVPKGWGYEKWIVNNGKLIREGEEQNDEKINQNIEISDTVLDSMGNEIKVKKEKVLTAREKKKLEKKKAERRKKGLPSQSDEDYYKNRLYLTLILSLTTLCEKKQLHLI